MVLTQGTDKAQEGVSLGIFNTKALLVFLEQ